MSRALPAFGLGLMLALLFNQVIRLLPAPTANEDRHWYLQTVQSRPLLGWSGYPNFVGTEDGIPIQTNWRRFSGPRAGRRGGRPPNPVCSFLVTRSPGAMRSAWRSDSRLCLEASCGLVCNSLSALRAINKGMVRVQAQAQSLLDYTLAREGRPFEAVILALYHGERPHRQRRGGQSQRPTGHRLIRCERKIAGPSLCLEGVPSSPGYRLA